METDRLVLTAAQQQVLDVLVRSGGIVMRREDIYREAFDRPLPPRSRAVDVHVARIRRFLGEHAILTVGRVGYRFGFDPTTRNSLDIERLQTKTEP